MHLTAEEIAEICHEANRAIQIVHNDPQIPAGPPWVEATEEQRSSVLDGIHAVIRGRIHSAAESHDNWVRFKTANGWTLGEVKDETAKTHPDLKPFAELPRYEQCKARVFVALVNALRG